MHSRPVPATSSRLSNESLASIIHGGEAASGELRRDSRRMLTVHPAQAEYLLTTASIRIDALAGTPSAHTWVSWRALLVAGAGLVLALALLASRGEAEASFQPTSIDRRLTLVSLQTLSDYVGFEAKFSLGADDRTLVMSGSDLCGEDFPQLVPPALWRRVVDAGFETFECSAEGTQARFSVRR